MNHPVIFDAETHCYTVNGVRLPSVTQMLKPLYDFSAVPPEILKRAGAYGTAVHTVVELYLKDDLDESTLDVALVPALEAFKSFASDYPAMIASIVNLELPSYHARLMYAGTPDIECEYHLIDVKTRAFNPLTDPIQLHGYDAMITDNGRRNKRNKHVLHLKQDGTYLLTNANHKQASARFRYLLDHYISTKEINSWK